MKKVVLALLASMIANLAVATEASYLPSVIFQLDSKFSHHVLVVEKSTHKLHIFENSQQRPKLIKTYKIATGKMTGNKFIQGDKKTPEGIYQLKSFRSSKDLLGQYGKAGEIYGAGAFTTNYPNTIDRMLNKTGGGIWLHSTNDDNRVNKGLDSRGCVVAKDADLKDISQYIDLPHTPIIVTQELKFFTKETWETTKNEILTTLATWSQAWKEKNFATYIEQYSKEEFFSPSRGNYVAYKAYKKAVFARFDKPEINFKHISILNFDNYAVATMEQNYRSSVIQDTGKKVLYLKRNKEYQWKIVSEQWEKLPEQVNLAFTPKMRYFTEEGQVEKNDSGSI